MTPFTMVENSHFPWTEGGAGRVKDARHYKVSDKPWKIVNVLSCALFWRTKHKFVRNLVPKIATTKGISKPVSFCVHVAKSPYKSDLFRVMNSLFSGN